MTSCHCVTGEQRFAKTYPVPIAAVHQNAFLLSKGEFMQAASCSVAVWLILTLKKLESGC